MKGGGIPLSISALVSFPFSHSVAFFFCSFLIFTLFRGCLLVGLEFGHGFVCMASRLMESETDSEV